MWKDDVREWPRLNFQDIVSYFINAPACDQQPNGNYRSIVEGQNYLNSGWIGLIQHKFVGSTIILKGNVRYSQAINSYHNVEITVESTTITGVKCDCIVSEEKCCSHSAGLAFKVFEANKKGFIGMACTDQPCKWNKSTQQNVLPDSVENIRSIKRKSTENSMLSFETDAEVMQHLSSSHLQGLSGIQGTILNQIATRKSSDTTLDAFNFVHGLHNVSLNCKICRDIYYEHVHLSAVEATSLDKQTVNQKCALWTSQRKRRITSSVAATVPKRPKTDTSKWLKNHFSPTFSGNASTKYGQSHESCARAQYESDTGQKVISSGLVIRPEDSWLGASLDGIIDDSTICQTKCPTDKKLARYNNSVKCLIESGRYDVKIDNGIYYLRQTSAASGYYTQVQIAMHCSFRKKCKFMVWSPKDYVIANVHYDQKWTEDRIASLKTFYFEHMLPALTDMVLKNELKLIKLKM